MAENWHLEELGIELDKPRPMTDSEIAEAELAESVYMDVALERPELIGEPWIIQYAKIPYPILHIIGGKLVPRQSNKTTPAFKPNSTINLN